MARKLRALRFLGPAVLLLFGGFQIVAPDAAHAAGAVTINSAASCSGTTFCYVPPTVTVASGDTVTWTNQSGAAHTVTRCDATNCNGTDGGTGTDPAFDLSVASANGTAVNRTFNGAGTYNFYCKIHGFAVMHGIVTVQGQSGATTTTASGPTTTARPATTPGAVAPSPAPAPAAAPAQAVPAQANFTG